MNHTAHRLPPQSLEQTFSVTFSYPVYFTRGLFSPDNSVLRDLFRQAGERRRHRVLVCLDSGVASSIPGLEGEIRTWFQSNAEDVELMGEPWIVPGGEAAKNDPERVFELIRVAMRHRLCRHSFVMAIGGGGVLDTVGLAAALFHRGLRLIRVPTTVLAQNDAGVGVKNGINSDGVKNALGTFAPPFAVINDADFLRTLAEADWIGGIAEAFKVAIIQDAAFFEGLCRSARRLRERDEEAMEELIRRCADLHLSHIRTGGDPFEFGRARPLDFGHWSAHRLEMMSAHRVRHGQAVAMGIAVDSVYAGLMGWLSEQEVEAILHGLEECGFPLWYAENDLRDPSGRRCVLGGLEDFREHLGGELTVTFPRGIGRRHEVHEVDLAQMNAAFEVVRARAGR
jgi:3-dehydroquinate synthase